MRKENLLKTKSFDFAIRIVKFYKFLKEKRKEDILIKQVLRSGTSIGALIRESENAESTKDFVHKLTIALKEADETEYWLHLLFSTEYINKQMFDSIK
jgi:four helix bundle protein